MYLIPLKEIKSICPSNLDYKSKKNNVNQSSCGDLIGKINLACDTLTSSNYDIIILNAILFLGK